MKTLVSYQNCNTDLKQEVLVNIKELSRREPNQVEGDFNILNFDILCCERDWERTTRVFEQIKDDFQAIRVQDPGILAYVLENCDLPIEMVLENGHHNWAAIEQWVDLIGSRLKKIVLSYELPKNRLAEYSSKLKEKGIESEMLLVGDILLFYSPRMLLEKQIKKEQENIKLFADSEESPHKGFVVEQNLHGTFMYHLKKLFLLERYEEILKMDVTHVRVEYPTKEVLGFLEGSMNISEAIETFSFARTRGYFDINKSDVLFPKLKNEELEKQRANVLGEVVSSKKGSYTAIRVKQDFYKKERFSFITAEGKEFSSEIQWLKNIDGEEVDKALSGSLVMVNPVKKATARTLILD